MIARARRGTVVAAILAIVGTAHADPAGVGVIARGADRARVAAALAEAIGDGARTVPDAVAAARGELAAGAVPIAVMARFRHARELVDDGWRAYKRVAFDVAARQLAAAREEAEAVVALPGGPELYADASLRLGVVLAHVGRDADAYAAIALALALDPDRPLTLAEFSPDEVKLVDEVRAAPVVRRSVLVAAEPAGAAVAVDGRELGAAPIDTELAIGQHVVVGRAPRYAPRAVGVAVDATTAAVRVELDRDGDATRISAGADAATTDDAARELVAAVLRYVGVDEVVVVAAVERRGAPALLAQRCSITACTAVVEVGYAEPSGLGEAARAAWQDVRAAPLRGAAVAFDLQPSTTGSHRCEWCHNPYVLGGAGAAVVVGVIAAVVAITAGKPAPTVVVNPGGFGK